MLRTTIQTAGNHITIKLQGTLAGVSVQQLAALWRRTCRARLHEGMRVDLTCVSGIDEEGKRLLRTIRESGGALVADDPLTQRILNRT